MIALVFWYQVVPIPTHMPSLDIIISAFAAIAILFVLRAVIESRDTVREIKSSLYGTPHADEKTGLLHDGRMMKHELTALAQELAAHIVKGDEWRREAARLSCKRNDELQVQNTEVSNRLTDIEERLPQKKPHK